MVFWPGARGRDFRWAAAASAKDRTSRGALVWARAPARLVLIRFGRKWMMIVIVCLPARGAPHRPINSGGGGSGNNDNKLTSWRGAAQASPSSRAAAAESSSRPSPIRAARAHTHRPDCPLAAAAATWLQPRGARGRPPPILSAGLARERKLKFFTQKLAPANKRVVVVPSPTELAGALAATWLATTFKFKQANQVNLSELNHQLFRPTTSSKVRAGRGSRPRLPNSFRPPPLLDRPAGRLPRCKRPPARVSSKQTNCRDNKIYITLAHAFARRRRRRAQARDNLS
jgi:hypothetical protein